MAKHENLRGIPLPRGWPRRVKSAMLNIIVLAQYAVAYTCGSALDDHASNHVNAGRGARPAPGRVRSSPDSPAIDSHSRLSSLVGYVTCRSSC